MRVYGHDHHHHRPFTFVRRGKRYLAMVTTSPFTEEEGMCMGMVTTSSLSEKRKVLMARRPCLVSQMGLVVVVMTRYHLPLLQKGNGKGVEGREGSEGEGSGGERRGRESR